MILQQQVGPLRSHRGVSLDGLALLRLALRQGMQLKLGKLGKLSCKVPRFNKDKQLYLQQILLFLLGGTDKYSPYQQLVLLFFLGGTLFKTNSSPLINCSVSCGDVTAEFGTFTFFFDLEGVRNGPSVCFKDCQKTIGFSQPLLQQNDENLHFHTKY